MIGEVEHSATVVVEIVHDHRVHEVRSERQSRQRHPGGPRQEGVDYP